MMFELVGLWVTSITKGIKVSSGRVSAGTDLINAYRASKAQSLDEPPENSPKTSWLWIGIIAFVIYLIAKK